MNTSIPSGEGTIRFREHAVWYRVVGESEEPEKIPLLCLHGGPGVPHDYLEPLEAMADTGRRAIFYDQLGCGNSDRPSDPAMWTVELFVEEVGVVRDALGLDRIHLLGQSWGGMLAMEYALTQPAGLVSLTLASSLGSIQQWADEAERLLRDFPLAVRETLRKHEAAGTLDDPEYQEAMDAYYRRHVCRLDPWPDSVNRALERMGHEVYETMWGPTEPTPTGTLKDWDIRPRLGEITVPTLVTTGRHDEATPTIAGDLHKGIVGSELVIFEESSHMAHAEESERYLQVLGDFLSDVEANM